MEEHNSIFIKQELEHQQKQKLIDTTLELELLKNMNAELYNLLIKAREERDEARNMLQKLMNNRCPIEFQRQNSLGFLHSSSSSSSPEFSNTGRNHVNHYHNQNFNDSMIAMKKPVCDDDYGSKYIDYIAKQRVLPQKGKLLQAMYDAGPSLQTVLHQGQLPTWKNTQSQDLNSNLKSQVDLKKRQKYQ